MGHHLLSELVADVGPKKCSFQHPATAQHRRAMLAPRTVCSRCASRLHLASASVARFSAAADGVSAQSTERQPSDKAKAHRNSDAGRQRPQINQSNGSPVRSMTGKGKLSAVALFNDVVKRPSSDAAGQHSVPATTLGEWEIAAKMKELMEANVRTEEKLALFQSDIWPHVKELRGQIPKHLYMSTTKYLASACDAVAEEGLTGSSLALSSMGATIGKWELNVRNQLALSLCHVLLTSRLPSSERTAVVDELLDLWKHISQLRRTSQTRRGLHFVFPSLEETLREMPPPKDAVDPNDRPSNMAPASKALAGMFLQFRLEQAREVIPGLLATLAVLSDPRFARPGTQSKAAPMLSITAGILQRYPVDETYINEAFNSKIRFPPSKTLEVHSYVLHQWSQVVDMLGKDSAWRRDSSGHPKRGGAASASAASVLSSFHKQLRTAYRSRNTGAVVSIWQDLKARLARSPGLGRQLRQEAEFLDFWIFVWCAVRHSSKLQDTLTVMQELGVNPTVRTYTAMMHGWKMCKDADKIEALWQKLFESGLRLDTAIWTERISGLIEAGKPQAGIQALAEMLALWTKTLAAQEGNEAAAAATAVQPSIEVVNAAFMGLIRLDRKAANDVLAWAGREGIAPNIRTYNILLRETFRGDAPEDVQSLLKAMKKQNVEPDAATFTIILEEVLGAMDSASATEQVQAVQQVLSDIEAAGLQPNLETYGKMLYAVASLANGGADEAVSAVQAHMRAAGFSATPHMVTILIERALSRTCGADTVRAILEEHRLTSVNQGDQTLWERVMSAYAVTGDTAAAMGVFKDLAAAGRPVTSLPCLTDLMKALLADATDDSVASAREVVRVVLRHKMRKAATETGGRDARYWRHHFWYLAMENGLVDWDSVPVEIQAKLKG